MSDIQEIKDAAGLGGTYEFAGKTWKLAKFSFSELCDLDDLKALVPVEGGKLGLSVARDLILVMMRKTDPEIGPEFLDDSLDLLQVEGRDAFWDFYAACRKAGMPDSTKGDSKNAPAPSRAKKSAAAGNASSPS